MALQCHNKSCCQKFDPEKNRDDACQYHPGVPVFHDALKGWSCCDKRRRDFTDFLNIPGCTLGPHSSEKPAEPDITNSDASANQNEVVETKQEIRTPMERMERLERPAENEPKTRLKATVGATLKTALEKQMENMKLNAQDDGETAQKVIKKGEVCKNTGCSKEYDEGITRFDVCYYHPGTAIFHEGLKYWSCCKKKTTDFGNFLSQEGCTSADHVWIKEDTGETKVVCRYDWHQTANFVTISVFAKLTMPEKSWVDTNNVATRINLVFDGGKSHFTKNLVLRGIVDPAKSNVKMLGTKMEINLRKLEPGSWPTLEMPPDVAAKDES